MTDGAEGESLFLRKAIAGDRTAAQVLFWRNYGMLQDYVSRQIAGELQGAVSVEDIVQMAFTRAYASIAQFGNEDEGAFGGWLRAIAKNALTDRLRQLGREQTRKAKRPAEEVQNAEATFLILLDQIGDETGMPTTEAMRREAVAALQVAIANLPSDYRDVVRWHYFEQLSFDEIGERMGRTPGAARALCNRAKALLREELERLSRFL